MKRVGLAVPVYKNFPGFAELMASVDIPIYPYIIPNWKQNLGVSSAWNLAMYKANADMCEALFIVNDDVVFDPGTMRKMLIGLSEGHDLVTGYNTRDEDYSHLSETKYINSPDFACFVIDPLVFIAKFGFFDKNFYPAYFEDNDMHYRIKIEGGSAVKRTDAPFFHKGSVTQNWDGQQVVNGTMFEKNREYYKWKWGGVPGEETRTIPNQEAQDEEEGISIG